MTDVLPPSPARSSSVPLPAPVLRRHDFAQAARVPPLPKSTQTPLPGSYRFLLFCFHGRSPQSSCPIPCTFLLFRPLSRSFHRPVWPYPLTRTFYVHGEVTQTNTPGLPVTDTAPRFPQHRWVTSRPRYNSVGESFPDDSAPYCRRILTCRPRCSLIPE